jgi:integrase
MTLADLAEEYLAQHDGQPETTAKLRWLLTKATAAFGSTPLTELDKREIAAWRMTLPAGHRFEATQALRQTLARAVEWGLRYSNPAKTGVDNPQPPRREMRPFEADELEELAAELGPRYGPMILFAAATGLRPGEWIALEHRDIDRNERLVHVCEPSASTASSPPRPTPRAPCRSSDPRSRRSTSSRRSRARHPSWSPLPKAATLTSTTGAAGTGVPRSALPASRRPAASTICATRSPPSRCAPASAPTSFRATWAQPDQHRPKLRPPRAHSHHHAFELLDDCNGSCRDVDAGGRSVDVEAPPRPLAASTNTA